MSSVHVEVFHVYDGPYYSVYVGGVLADFFARDETLARLLTRAYRKRLCKLAGPSVKEGDLVFSVYRAAHAIALQGLDANDVAEDYAACQALGVKPDASCSRVRLAAYEAFAVTQLGG